MKHTKAPWKVENYVSGGGLLLRNEAQHQNSLQIVPIEDAILMSAAPELLEACIATIPCLEDWVRTTGFGEVNRRDKKVLELIHQAITKATKQIE